MLNIGANISFGGITASIANTTQNYDHLSMINALADFPSASWRPADQAIISGTARHQPVLCGIVFMLRWAFSCSSGSSVGWASTCPRRALRFLLVISLP